ncbi:hypothetical protein [Streptomyces tauricus]|uniref:hypothetical protein n=1 Tax=Streptomyces tauricus TaxID=68274 RepID=UPI0034109E8F
MAVQAVPVAPSGTARSAAGVRHAAVNSGWWSTALPVALSAAAEAVTRARTTGIASVGVRGTVHTGAIGYHVSKIAEQGMAGPGFAAAVDATLGTLKGLPVVDDAEGVSPRRRPLPRPEWTPGCRTAVPAPFRTERPHARGPA